MSSLEDVFSAINLMLEAGEVDRGRLRDILTRHGLSTGILDGA